MIDLIVYDKNLQPVALVDNYISLIWTPRYVLIGDCEIKVAATVENINIFQREYYIGRNDDKMLCRIMKIEIDTDAENGNTMIVYGYEAKNLLDQRIIWDISTSKGNLETFIRDLIYASCINPTIAARKMKTQNGETLIGLGNPVGFQNSYTGQVSYKNLGEKIREWCTANSWGYRLVRKTDVAQLGFELYRGQDKSATVKFSPAFDNLSTSKYIHDITGQGNVALVGAEGEGSARVRETSGSATGTDRFEIFVDAKDISATTTWKNVQSLYPQNESGNPGTIIQTGYVLSEYQKAYLNIYIINANHLAWLVSKFPDGTVITDGGKQYYHVTDIKLGWFQGVDAPTDDTKFFWYEVVYIGYLFQRGQTKIEEFGIKETFEGVVFPDVTFLYKKDYDLGDVVTVENEYGISAAARITEVIESVDENGYTVLPKFEYINVSGG